jgi:dethiobiotin synthetase
LRALFIAGTDTDAGKTLLITALGAYWQTYCPSQRLALLKPLQSGLGDRELYQQLFQLNQTADEINPLHFQAPLAPPLAAELEGRDIDLAIPWRTLRTLQAEHDFVLVEGVGGLGSPITRELTNADLVHDWQLPTVLVVPVRLGAIGQTVANVALARQARVGLRGIILNCQRPCSDLELAQWAPADLLTSLTQIPVLGILPYLENPHDLGQLAAVASNLHLEAIWPLQPD